VLVASSEEALKSGQGDMWDSGVVTNDETLNIVYAGRPLASGQKLFWKAQSWDGDGQASKWSAPATWSMGLLAPGDWKAEWISFRDSSPVHADRKNLLLPPARHYRKNFTTAKPVRRATLHFSALGIAEFHLNGRRVGDAYFEPGWSDYLRRAYYRTHDVTKLVTRGGNCIGAIVAEGWYAGYVGYGLLVGYGPNKTGRNFYGKTPALLAQLEVEYADGSRETIVTDPSWEVSGDGPFREADLIMGEAHDARRENPDWCVNKPFIDRDDAWRWDQAVRAGENGGVKATYSDTLGAREMELGFQKPPVLQAYAAPAIRVTQELKARRVTEPKPGVYIFDLGQNFAGVVRLKVKAPAGTRIQLRHGEMLHPDGRLMTENLRKARATDFYTCSGKGTEVWSPRFTYHGFQFVEVTGLPSRPSPDAVTGLVLHNDTPITGSFACSDPVMTRFSQNAQWTQRANFIEMPTDCPQRDERLGWMGDAQIYARTATYNADVAAFYTKWIDDVREAQRDFGAYPDYCPYPMAHGSPGATHGTAWTDAGVIVPFTVWEVYGDTRVIAKHWDSMTKFMDWRRKADPELKGVKLGNTWGDWLNVNEETPIEYVDLVYHRLSARCMAAMAVALGREDDAGKYTRLLDELAASFRKRHLRPDGSLAVDTQSAYVLALQAGLIPPELAGKSAEILAAKIAKNGHRMATGFLGTKPLLPVLTAHGQHDLAIRLFQSRQFPSWGYEVEQGANTVWERWDSFTKEHGFNGAAGNQNASMNSFSHYAFGAAMQWAWQNLAGIDTGGQAWKQIIIKPHPPSAAAVADAAPISWVQADYNSPRGRITSAWRQEGGKFSLDVHIPANTSARVFMPALSSERITEDGRPLARVKGVKLLSHSGGRAELEAGAGQYRFESR
jgi:alpha-L-rhamnosidase